MRRERFFQREIFSYLSKEIFVKIRFSLVDFRCDEMRVELVCEVVPLLHQQLRQLGCLRAAGVRHRHHLHSAVHRAVLCFWREVVGVDCIEAGAQHDKTEILTKELHLTIILTSLLALFQYLNWQFWNVHGECAECGKGGLAPGRVDQNKPVHQLFPEKQDTTLWNFH